MSNRPILLVDPDGREQPTVMDGKVVMGGLDGLSAGNNHAKNVMLGILSGGTVVGVIVAMDIAKAFGQSPVFGIVLLFLLAGIGYLILGFGSARYLGPPNQQARAAIA